MPGTTSSTPSRGGCRSSRTGFGAVWVWSVTPVVVAEEDAGPEVARHRTADGNAIVAAHTLGTMHSSTSSIERDDVARTKNWSFVVTLGAIVGFVSLPSRIVGGATVDPGRLTRSASSAVTGYWIADTRSFTTDLDQLVADWRWYHAVKAVMAVIVAASAIRFVVLQRRRATVAVHHRRIGGRISTAAMTAVAGVAVLLAMANIQGTFSPFASLLSLLPAGSDGGSFATTSAQIEQALAQGGSRPPAVDAMLADFGRYHAVLAAMAVLVCIGLVALALGAFRRRSTGRLWPLVGYGAPCAVLAVIALANVTNALHPADGLHAFFAS